jgi:hypothetical protein
MEARIAVEKLPYYTPTPDRLPDLVPVRHACGRILYAFLEGEGQIFYRDIKGQSLPIHDCPHCEYPLDMDWMRPLWRVHPMPYWMAVLTIARRVCSNCWGRLDMTRRDIAVQDADGNWEAHRIVFCPECQHETIGYVTHRWVDTCRQQDATDYEATFPGLAEMLGIEVPKPPEPKKSRNELLNQLGF